MKDHVFYDCSTAPSPRRSRIFMAEKGLEIPTVQVDLRSGEHMGKAYRAINSRCTVPALKLPDGTVLCDTSSIARYLEEVCPDPPLMGRNPVEKALVAEWNTRAEMEGLWAAADAVRNSSPGLKGRALPGPDNYEQIPALAERGLARIRSFMTVLETRLRETPWLAGDAFSNADITTFVFVEFAAWVKITPDSTQTAIREWLEAIRARPAASA